MDKSLVDLIESMYKQTKCSVMVNGKITEWFDVITGVRKGCPPLSKSLQHIPGICDEGHPTTRKWNTDG